MVMSHHAAIPVPAITAMRARSFPGQPAQVRQARTFIAAVLRGSPAAENAVLLASELAANAVAHSASGHPGGSFTLRVSLDDTRIYAEVEDQGSTWDGNVNAAESPHGLYLLRRLSTESGARPGQRGWITWFTIAGEQVTQP